ncbi:MAG: RNA methyltransferase [Terriglobus sp.]
MPERITSRTNARVKALRAALTTRKSDRIGIEGFHLIREAIASGLQLDTLYLREDLAHLLRDLPEDAAQEVLLLSPDAFQAATETENAQGAAALLKRPALPYAARTGDLILIADGLQDPGNLGTLIRSAEAFGASAVALTPGTVDPWNGKCLRAAAGAAFRVPLPRCDADFLAALSAVDTQLLAAVAKDGEAAHSTDLKGTIALIIGNEGAGVSEKMRSICDKQITLATTGPTESLNAAVAGSLLLYEASQQRNF